MHAKRCVGKWKDEKTQDRKRETAEKSPVSRPSTATVHICREKPHLKPQLCRTIIHQSCAARPQPAVSSCASTPVSSHGFCWYLLPLVVWEVWLLKQVPHDPTLSSGSRPRHRRPGAFCFAAAGTNKVNIGLLGNRRALVVKRWMCNCITARFCAVKQACVAAERPPRWLVCFGVALSCCAAIVCVVEVERQARSVLGPPLVSSRL